MHTRIHYLGADVKGAARAALSATEANLADRMQVGERFERRVVWTREEITSFAREVGDTNPMHEDEAFAASTRFGRLIASGSQTVAIMTALCGAQATAQNPGLGLEFNFRLVGPAYADEEILFCWEVVAVEDSTRPRGRVVSLRGEALGAGVRPIIAATAKTLYVDTL